MDTSIYVFRNKQTGEYWLEKGKTVPEIYKAARFDADGAKRFYRNVSHPNKWIKERYL